MKDAIDKALVLLSGGMDSVTLLHHVKKRIGCRALHALSFDYGQKHSRELEMAEWQAQAVGVVEHRIVRITFIAEATRGASALTDEALVIPDLSELPADRRHQPPTYVPNRNMVLLSIAAAYAEARGIEPVFYGAQQSDEYGYWDCSAEFLKRLNALLALNREHRVTVHAPFIAKRKSEELRVGFELGVDYSHTWTCYRGREKACGTCPACVERLKAFSEIGRPDPLPYAGTAAGP